MIQYGDILNDIYSYFLQAFFSRSLFRKEVKFFVRNVIPFPLKSFIA